LNDNDEKTLLLFPGALGDFLCLWPALSRLLQERHGRVTVAAKPSHLELLPADSAGRMSIDRRELADLFGPAPLAPQTRELLADFACVHSWTGWGNESFAQRVGEATRGRLIAHRFRGMNPGEHAAAYYARCLGVRVPAARYPPPVEAQLWAEHFWRRNALAETVLAIAPGSGAAAKNWEGMNAVARRWRSVHGAQVLALIGPAELERHTRLPCDAVAVAESLPNLAALLVRSRCFLGNDSGVSHLAGLTGVPGVVLFGPTDPATWKPIGNTLAVLTAPVPCPSCGASRFCTHRLAVEMVEDAVRSAVSS
jgi:Glycosyltransferase family 9 (heptosyltransferase)